MHLTCLNLHTLRCRQSAYVQYASFLRLVYADLFCVICTSYLSPVPYGADNVDILELLCIIKGEEYEDVRGTDGAGSESECD